MNLKETNRIWLPKWKAVTLVDGSKGKYIFLASNNDRVRVHGSKDHQKHRGAPCDIKTVTRGHRIYQLRPCKMPCKLGISLKP